MGWLEIIGQVLKLGVLILVEIFEEKKRARLANEKHELTLARFEEVAQKCLLKFRSDAAQDHQGAVDVEDKVEDSIKKP